MPYQCRHCGQEHQELFDVSSDRPDVYFMVPEDERDERTVLTKDWCVVDRGLFLIRGLIEIPIVEIDETFAFGIWATQRAEDFDLYRDFPESTTIGPFPGQLDGYLPCYEPHSTRGLRVIAHFDRPGERPRFILDEADYPLVQQQREGITLGTALWIQHQFFTGPS